MKKTDKNLRRGTQGRLPHQWTPEMIALLGTACDREVAQKLGLPLTTVWTKRVSLGIRGHQRRDPTAARNKEIRRLRASGIELEEIAHRYGLTKQRVHQITHSIRRPKGYLPVALERLLGRVSDRQVAEEAALMGIRRSPAAIAWARRERGIVAITNLADNPNAAICACGEHCARTDTVCPWCKADRKRHHLARKKT